MIQLGNFLQHWYTHFQEQAASYCCCTIASNHHQHHPETCKFCFTDVGLNIVLTDLKLSPGRPHRPPAGAPYAGSGAPYPDAGAPYPDEGAGAP